MSNVVFGFGKIVAVRHTHYCVALSTFPIWVCISIQLHVCTHTRQSSIHYITSCMYFLTGLTAIVLKADTSDDGFKIPQVSAAVPAVRALAVRPPSPPSF